MLLPGMRPARRHKEEEKVRKELQRFGAKLITSEESIAENVIFATAFCLYGYLGGILLGKCVGYRIYGESLFPFREAQQARQ